MSSQWTFENVELNKEYKAPQNDDVVLTFTKLPDPSGNIKIEEITLTQEQMEQTGSLSDKAYDITSDMTDETFSYTLSLPIPESAKNKDVAIKYAEKIEELPTAHIIENVTKTDTSVSTEQIDHMTIFFVYQTQDSSDGSEQIVSVSENNLLTASDNNRMTSDGKWDWFDYKNNRYIDFRFNPNIPTGATVTSPITVNFEYQRDALAPGSYVLAHKARLQIFNQTTSNWETLTDNIKIDEPSKDKLFTLTIPNQYVNSINKINNLELRFQTTGRKPLSFDGIKTYHNFVALNVSYTLPAPVNGQPHNTSIPTNDFYFEWDAVDDTRPVTYEFQSSHSNSVDSNGSLIGAWNSILHGNAEQNHLTLPKIHSTGASDGTYYWQVRAINSDGSPSPWSEVWNMTIDRIAPIITIGPYDGTTPTNQNIVVTASTNEGMLNENSHTFTTNGSFDFVATDAAGNTTTETVTITNIDKDAPSIPSGIYFKDTDNNKNIACGGRTNTKHLNVYWNANTESDFNHYEYISFNAGGSTGPIRNFFTNYFNASWWTIPLEGTYGVQIRAVDHVGNKSDWFGGTQGVNNSCTYIVDWTAPVITIHPYLTTQTNQNITVTASTNEGSLNETSHTFTENGSFTFIATDLAGNTSSEIVTITNIDKVPPSSPELNLPVDNAIVKGNPIQSWSLVSDADHYVYESYNNSDGTNKIYSTTLKTTSRTVGGNQNITFYWRVKAVDVAGNESWSLMRKLTIDNIAPTSVSSTSFSNWYNTNQTATFTYSDANGIVSGNNPTCDITTEGVNQTCSVTPNVCDTAGNCNTTPVTSNGANIDFTLPASIITFPENPNSESTIYTNAWDGSIQGTASDTLSGVQAVQVSIQNSLGQFFDGDSFIDTENEILRDTTFSDGNWEYTGLTTPLEDSYIIQSHAIDNAGNIENTYEITIILDKTIPEVALSINPTVGDGENGWYKTQPEITLTATDEHIDKIEYQWNSETGEWITYTSPFKPTTEGAHVLYYRALDLANNYSETGIKNIAWDNTALEKAPQNVSVSPNPSNGKNVKVTWEAATDNTGVDHYTITWKKDGVSERGTTVSETTREYIIPDTLTEGVWNVKVTAVDKAGFTADASTNATVDLTAPAAPTLALTGTGVGSVSLAWNAVEDAVDYSVWYGTTPGVYDYAAHVGNVTSYTIQGLGAGTYYVVVAAYDNVVNRSAFSNEVNTGGAIEGAPGATTGPAEGFQPAGSVLGSETVNPEVTGQTLGTTTTAPSISWWFILIGLLLIIIALYIYYRQRRKNR